YYTDIITFELNEKNEPIIGDIYISIDRVKENSKLYQTTFIQELNRVIIHGVLHLCGYKDKSKKDEQLMRKKENYYLNKI
ncbi:MAG: rRNA maturation RNase YbeY, partial [Bacteroidia bacterium]|nr:rRNA maturation RNase YbeY [Bacteroidia bacterium]